MSHSEKAYSQRPAAIKMRHLRASNPLYRRKDIIRSRRRYYLAAPGAEARRKAEWRARNPAKYRAAVRRHAVWLRARDAKRRGLIVWEIMRRLRAARRTGESPCQT